MHRYRSARYPEVSAPVLAGLSIGRPLAVCMLPIMILSLVAMLDARDPLPFALWSTPIAVSTAWFWTRQQLRGTIVEILIDGAGVTLRSAWDVASGRPPGSRQAVLDLRRGKDRLQVTVGLDTHTLTVADFARPDDLFDRLDDARRLHVQEVHSRLESPRQPLPPVP